MQRPTNVYRLSSSIVPSNNKDKEKKKEDWTAAGDITDKLGKVLDAAENQGVQLSLPDGMTVQDLKNWIPRVINSLTRVNPLERTKGRTGLEEWAEPVGFAIISSNMGGGGWSDAAVGEMVYRELLNHGRQTTTELKDNLGAVDPHLVTFVINGLALEKFIVEYTEEDGLKTWELVETSKRNRMLGRPTDDAKEKPKLEEKEKEKEKES